jgi:hypothetical protein
LFELFVPSSCPAEPRRTRACRSTCTRASVKRARQWSAGKGEKKEWGAGGRRCQRGGWGTGGAKRSKR